MTTVDGGLEILHADDFLVAVRKPAGMATIAEAKGDADCLHARLERQLARKLWIVHRLDKGVTGLVVFACTADAHRWLNGRFEARDTVKRYQAVCHGAVEGESGVVELPLRIFGSGRTGPDPVNGKPSRTDWTVIGRSPAATRLEIRLHTGRKHQIRAHLCAIGHPLLGDDRYGHVPEAAAFPRLMLHSWTLSVPLPSGQVLGLECPPDAEFETLWGRCRGTAGV